ncbi:hypothetical protein B0I35DRAFT_422919 [Stachybotrys elegans]|uniref:Uncharacterized protein n=1 Tax=Stachybotrys elegans TaxID=80388 RepID=A0A8K0WX38_9HYPO|nr:hypothetical protein B0I35DRAFT_422919 [Stachybotrys elegans]
MANCYQSSIAYAASGEPPPPKRLRPHNSLRPSLDLCLDKHLGSIPSTYNVLVAFHLR